MTIFTICSNNYLAQAVVLGNSIKEKSPSSEFIIFLCDVKVSSITYSEIGHRIIELACVNADMDELAKKYNIIELNTAVKPKVFQYIFSNLAVEKAIYLDPDICVFNDLAFFDKELDSNSVLLSPHILTPIPHDGKKPDENLFLNHGIYNLGFIGLRNDDTSKNLLDWWKNHTYYNGFIDLRNGVFVDQLPINFVPLFFKGVKILTDLGVNMGPWNLHERRLNLLNGDYFVNKIHRLYFYHFSSFKIDTGELPNYYNRQKMEDRSDLKDIYHQYNDRLRDANIYFFKNIKSAYSEKRELELKKIAASEWKKKSALKKALIYFKRAIPSSIKSYLKQNTN